MKHFLWLALLLPFLTGCSITLNESNHYTTEDVAGRKVLILAPALDSIVVNNRDDIEDDFNGDKRDPRLVLRNAFCKSLVKNLKQKVEQPGKTIFESDSLIELSLRDTTNLFAKQLLLRNEQRMINFYLPKKEWLIAQGKKPDIVVVITNLVYGRDLSYSGGMGHFMPGTTVSTPHGSFNTGGMYVGGGGSIPYLGGMYTFIIYDYNKDKWISFGQPTVSHTIFLWGLTRGGWENTFEEAADKLLEKSPWEKRSNSY